MAKLYACLKNVLFIVMVAMAASSLLADSFTNDVLFTSSGQYSSGTIFNQQNSLVNIGEIVIGNVFISGQGLSIWAIALGATTTTQSVEASDPAAGITANVALPPGAVDIQVEIRTTLSAVVASINLAIPQIDAVNGEKIVSINFLKSMDINLYPVGSDIAFTGTITINSPIEVTIYISPKLTSTANVRVLYLNKNINEWAFNGIVLKLVEPDRIIFTTSHLTYFAVAQITSVFDSIAPQIKQIMLNNSIVVTNDISTEQPTVNIVATDNVGVTAFRVRVYTESGTLLEDSTTTNIQSSTSTTINYKLASAISAEGNYYFEATVLDSAGNSTTNRSSVFRVRKAGNFVFTDVLSAPNPFTPQKEVAHIGYQLNKSAEVKLYIHNISGALIYSDVMSGQIGYNEFKWQGESRFGSTVRNGGYLAYLLAESEGQTIKRLVKIGVINQ